MPLSEIRTGSEKDFSNIINTVINEAAFGRIMANIDIAITSSHAEIFAGGKDGKSKGYFMEPTVILVSDPHFTTLQEEIFGPVISILIYYDDKCSETLMLCYETLPLIDLKDQFSVMINMP